MGSKGVLPEFQDYLLSHKLATQKNVLYLAIWVSKFLAFNNHLLMKGVSIREIQELLGHKSVETTMIYTHVLRNIQDVPMSPLDALMKDEP